MKNLLFVFAFVLAVGSINAQKVCSKSEAKACAKAGVTCIIMEDGAKTDVASALAAAELAADNNEHVEKKVCSKSGSISFFKSSTCAVSGKVSKEEVLYDVKSASFVNVSPKDMISDNEAQIIKTSKEEAGTKAKTCAKSGKKCCASKKKGA